MRCRLDQAYSECFSDAAAQSLEDDLEALKNFYGAVKRLENGEDDPCNLHPAFDIAGQRISNVYLLKVGKWKGYYRLDIVARVGTAMLAFYGPPDPQQLSDVFR
jgi:hypothetical protein